MPKPSREAKSVRPDDDDDDDWIADGKATGQPFIEFNKKLFAILGLVLLSSALAFQIGSSQVTSSNSLNDLVRTEPISVFTLDSSHDAEAKESESNEKADDVDGEVAKELSSENDSVDTLDDTVPEEDDDTILDDEEKVSEEQLESEVSSTESSDTMGAEQEEAVVAESVEKDEEIIEVELASESDPDLIPSSASLSSDDIVDLVEEPTLANELNFTALPPSFAAVHQFTRPVKEKLGSRFNKESREKIANKVRDALEKELNSDHWM